MQAMSCPCPAIAEFPAVPRTAGAAVAVVRRLSRSWSAVSAVALLAGLLLVTSRAEAQLRAPAPAVWGPAVTGAVLHGDYGTGAKLQLGLPLPGVLGGHVGVETQLAYLGSERFTLAGSGHRRSAWALGGSALGGVALGESFAAYGKLGAHWVRSQTSGPLSSGHGNDLELGVGAGLHWQVSPATALRLELENIGGHGGDLLSLGLHLRL